MTKRLPGITERTRLNLDVEFRIRCYQHRRLDQRLADYLRIQAEKHDISRADAIKEICLGKIPPMPKEYSIDTDLDEAISAIFGEDSKSGDPPNSTEASHDRQ